MTFNDFIKKVFFVEIAKGLALTMKELFTPAVTRQYPKEKRNPFPGARALHALVRSDVTGEAKCVGCGLCAAVCPSKCIHIYTTEGSDTMKVVNRYEIDVLRCVFCAFCVEACPFGAIALTDHFEYSGYSREEFHYTKERLLENWDKYMAGDKGKIYFERFWGPKEKDIAHSKPSVAAGGGA
ncbi:MAG: NADH-quinone oxidoreductase subunit NuoI [Nitrospirae bacterium]|nr:NADH-quinone oxidoreductase subunit NuoI [Nitrospirota bacterium]